MLAAFWISSLWKRPASPLCCLYISDPHLFKDEVTFLENFHLGELAEDNIQMPEIMERYSSTSITHEVPTKIGCPLRLHLIGIPELGNRHSQCC